MTHPDAVISTAVRRIRVRFYVVDPTTGVILAQASLRRPTAPAGLLVVGVR